MNETQTDRKRPGLARRGCLGCMAIIVLGIAGFFLVSAILRGPDAREVYSGAPDPVATARLNAELQSHGLNGASALVIPIKGQSGQIAILTLDESQGFQGTGMEGFNAFAQSLVDANREGDHNITQVAVGYRGPDGEELFTVATDEATLEGYASGQITREEMLANTDANLSNLLAAFDLYQEAEGGQ